MLSFEECTPMSSSFLNKSIGNLISKYGINVFESKVKIVKYTRATGDNLKSYISDFNKFHIHG